MDSLLSFLLTVLFFSRAKKPYSVIVYWRPIQIQIPNWNFQYSMINFKLFFPGSIYRNINIKRERCGSGVKVSFKIHPNTKPFLPSRCRKAGSFKHIEGARTGILGDQPWGEGENPHQDPRPQPLPPPPHPQLRHLCCHQRAQQYS